LFQLTAVLGGSGALIGGSGTGTGSVGDEVWFEASRAVFFFLKYSFLWSLRVDSPT
jgi:hypothetical protein